MQRLGGFHPNNAHNTNGKIISRSPTRNSPSINNTNNYISGGAIIGQALPLQIPLQLQLQDNRNLSPNKLSATRKPMMNNGNVNNHIVNNFTSRGGAVRNSPSPNNVGNGNRNDGGSGNGNIAGYNNANINGVKQRTGLLSNYPPIDSNRNNYESCGTNKQYVNNNKQPPLINSKGLLPNTNTDANKNCFQNNNHNIYDKYCINHPNK